MGGCRRSGVPQVGLGRAAAGGMQCASPPPRPLHRPCPPPVCTNAVNLPGLWPHRLAGLPSGVVPSSPGGGEWPGQRLVAHKYCRYFPPGSSQDWAPRLARGSELLDRQRTRGHPPPSALQLLLGSQDKNASPRLMRPCDPPPRARGPISSSAATPPPFGSPGEGGKAGPGSAFGLSRWRTNAKASLSPGSQQPIQIWGRPSTAGGRQGWLPSEAQKPVWVWFTVQCRWSLPCCPHTWPCARSWDSRLRHVWRCPQPPESPAFNTTLAVASGPCKALLHPRSPSHSKALCLTSRPCSLPRSPSPPRSNLQVDQMPLL